MKNKTVIPIAANVERRLVKKKMLQKHSKIESLSWQKIIDIISWQKLKDCYVVLVQKVTKLLKIKREGEGDYQNNDWCQFIKK